MIEEFFILHSSFFIAPNLVPLCHFHLLRRPVTSCRDLHKPMAAPVRFPRTLSSLKCSASASSIITAPRSAVIIRELTRQCQLLCTQLNSKTSKTSRLRVSALK